MRHCAMCGQEETPQNPCVLWKEGKNTEFVHEHCAQQRNRPYRKQLTVLFEVKRRSWLDHLLLMLWRMSHEGQTR